MASDSDSAPPGPGYRLFDPRKARRRKTLEDAGLLAPAGGDGAPGEDERERERGRSCPITPLGDDNGAYYFLSPTGRLRGFKYNGLSDNGIASLFDGEMEWPLEYFPYDKNPLWNGKHAAAWLMKAAAACGPFSLAQVRGVGAWRLDDRRLVIHVGGRLLVPLDVAQTVEETDRIAPARFPPGYGWIAAGVRIGRHVYPTGDTCPAPADQPMPAAQAQELLTHLSSWRWGAPPAAPRLLFGWICNAWVAGALRWRPHVWITGGEGSGKSSLEDLIRGLHGDGIVGLSAPTEYAVRELLGGDARPVVIDEVRGGPEDRGNVKRLLGLAKLASLESQSAIAKGAPGGDGSVRRWAMRAAFYFTSVIHADLNSQERSRITVLDLASAPVGDDGGFFERQQAHWKAQGGALFARVLARWGDYGPALAVYKAALSGMGSTRRQADQLGALLAMADIILSDEPPSIEAAREIVDSFDVGDFAGQEDESDAFRCINRLLTWPVTVHPTWENRGTFRQTVEYILSDMASPPQLYYQRALRVLGLQVRQLLQPGGGDEKRWCLGVPHQHAELERVFDGTDWERGGWAQSLARYPGAFKQNTTARVGLRTVRCTWVAIDDLALLPPLDDWVEEAASAERAGME